MCLLPTVSFLLYVFAWATPCFSVPTDDGVWTAGDEALARARNLGKSEYETASPSLFSFSSEKEPVVGGVFRASESGCKSCHVAGYEAAGSRPTRSTKALTVPVNKPQLGRILGIDLRWDSCSGVDCHVSPDVVIGGQHYETAIYAVAPSVTEFNLGDGFDRLHTCFGVCCYGFGTVNFRVTGDNKVLLDWQKKTYGEVATCIDIDLNGVTTLKLETNDAGDRSGHDFASWGNSYVYNDGIQCYGVPSTSRQLECANGKMGYESDRWNGCVDQGSVRVRCPKGHYPCNALRDNGKEFICGTTCENQGGKRECKLKELACFAEPSTHRQLECANGKLGYATDRWNGCVDQGSVRVRCPKGHYPCNELRDNLKEFICGTICENFGGKRTCSSSTDSCLSVARSDRFYTYRTDRWTLRTPSTSRSANGGYYTCDFTKSSDECIFVKIDTAPWTSTVEHNMACSPCSFKAEGNYCQVEDESGKGLSLSPKPWTNGDEIKITETQQTGDAVTYTLIFELVAPLRNLMMFHPGEATADIWSALTKAFVDCKVKDMDEEGDHGTAHSVDNVYSIMRNPNGKDIHHSVLQFLEEGAIDLVCIATDLSMSQCDTIRAKWSVEAGTRCDCWLPAYKALYGVDASIDVELTKCI